MNYIVKASGDPKSKIAFVGEAPGEYEVKMGKPFVGPAGEELWRLCHTANIARTDCYITNVVKERPPANDISKFITFDKYGSAHETQAFTSYKSILIEELASTSCNIIVCLGNVALYALTGLTGITKRRGSVYEIDIKGTKRKVMGTIHPSALIRQYGKIGQGNFLYQYYVIMDLRRAVKESEKPEYTPQYIDIRVSPSYSDILLYLQHLIDNPMPCGFDIEVVNEEVSCLSVSYASGPSYVTMSIPFTKRGFDYLTPDQEVDVMSKITTIMEEEAIPKIGQNFVFDTGFMFRKYGMLPKTVDCTMIGMAILFPDFPRGLDFIASMYTDLAYYKDDGKKYFKIGGDEVDFWTYNAKDSVVCSIAFPKIQAELIKQGNLETYYRQVKMIQPCIYMQERGMRMDVEGLKKASDDAQKKIDSMQEELNTVAGQQLNPNSPKQLIEYFYFKKRIKPYIGKSGNMTTDEDAMRRLAREGIKEAQLIRDIRKIRKLKGTYLDVTLSKDGRLRSAMNPGKTKTGRLASGEDIFGEGTNVQNFPKGVRHYMLTDKDYVCYVCDLSQAENRIVANIAPEPVMLDVFANGKDMHSITGSYISGIPAEEVKRQDGEGIKCTMGTGDFTWRFWGKKLNHSLNYDLGYKSFALKTDLTEREAKPMVESWHQLYSGIRQYHAWIKAKLQIDRTLTNLMGRKRLFLGRLDDKTYKEAYAQIPQSSVADKIDEHGVEYLYYEEQELFYPVDLLNQIHDSVIFQLPLSIPWEHHAEILIKLKESLEQPLTWRDTKIVIPLDIKMHIHNLSDKDGKGVDIDGKDIRRLAEKLSSIYREHGSPQQVQVVDWDIGTIGMLEEEGEDSLGDGDDIL